MNVLDVNSQKGSQLCGIKGVSMVGYSPDIMLGKFSWIALTVELGFR